MSCPLCQGESSLFYQDKKRHYYCCGNCNLIFVPKNEFVSKERESARYKNHNNSRLDPRYTQYLSKVCDDFLEMDPTGTKGIDFGCGESTLLAEFFNAKGNEVSSFDPLFHPNTDWMNYHYNFFTLSEVLEHLHEPLKIISSLKDHLFSEGMILIKTEFLPINEEKDFKDWYYKNDETHIHFYNEKSSLRLAQEVGMKISYSPAVRGVFALIKNRL